MRLCGLMREWQVESIKARGKREVGTSKWESLGLPWGYDEIIRCPTVLVLPVWDVGTHCCHCLDDHGQGTGGSACHLKQPPFPPNCWILRGAADLKVSVGILLKFWPPADFGGLCLWSKLDS